MYHLHGAARKHLYAYAPIPVKMTSWNTSQNRKHSPPYLHDNVNLVGTAPYHLRQKRNNRLSYPGDRVRNFKLAPVCSARFKTQWSKDSEKKWVLIPFLNTSTGSASNKIVYILITSFLYSIKNRLFLYPQLYALFKKKIFKHFRNVD